MNLKPYAHVLVMVLVLFAAFAAYGAWYSKVGKESALSISLLSDIQAKTQNVAREHEARSQLTRAMSDRAQITGYFVNTNDVVPFLETLQSAGAKYGSKVQVESVSAQPAKPHTLLQLALRVTGSFDSVERTLGAIEYEPYDTTITNVTLDTPGAGGAGILPQWTAAVTLNVGTVDSAATTTASSTTP